MIKKLKAKLAFLYIGSFLVTVLPLAVTLFIKRQEYISTVPETVKLSAGLLMGGIFILLKVMGRLKMPARLTLYVIITVMAYLLAPLLDDLILLGCMAILGELCDAIFFASSIKKTKEAIVTEATSSATADKVEEIIKKYMGGTQ